MTEKMVPESLPGKAVWIGTTKWLVYINLITSLPEGTTSPASLILYDPKDENNRMWVGFGERVSHLTVDEVSELARNPDKRQIIGSDGAGWNLTPLPKSPGKVRAVRPGQRTNYIQLPEGLQLGEVSTEDLLEQLDLLT